MENHPIPQDVTGFQFRLIGDMTVKQFAYLATGAVLAWISFVLPLSIFIRLPFSILFFSLGASMAFLPVAGRPLDTMILYFIKAIFTPNLYIYQKQGGNVAIFSLAFHPHKKVAHHDKILAQKPQVRFEALLKTLPQKPKNELDEKEMTFLKSLSGIFSAQHAQSSPQPSDSTHIVSLHEEDEKERKKEKEDKAMKELKQLREPSDIQKEAQAIKEALDDAKKQELQQAQKGITTPNVHQKVLSLERELNEVLQQKALLEKKFLELQSKLEDQKQKVFTPTTLEVREETPRVRKVPREMGVKVGLPITSDVPNLLSGIIKDPRKNVLPNILVEVKDKEGNPVRAFKTNSLGQFQSATPLLNGVYTLEFEDPDKKHKFDVVEITLNGTVIMPLEIISMDEREELHRELFGVN